MRQFNTHIRISARVAWLIAGICAVQGASAASLADTEWQRLSEEGWQMLAPPTAVARDGRGSEPVVANRRAAAIPAASSPATPTSVATTSAAAPASAPTAITASFPAERFALVRGQSLQAQLEAWAARAGWTVEWNVPDGWIVPNDKSLGSDFAQAAQQAIEQLAENGADVQADIWNGNRVLVVHQAGVGE
jgi:hypothetical protein